MFVLVGIPDPNEGGRFSEAPIVFWDANGYNMRDKKQSGMWTASLDEATRYRADERRYSWRFGMVQKYHYFLVGP